MYAILCPRSDFLASWFIIVRATNGRMTNKLLSLVQQHIANTPGLETGGFRADTEGGG